MNSFIKRPLCLIVVVLSVFAYADQASAAVRRHRATGSAQFTSPTDFVGSGHATHLGAYTETGTVAFSPSSDPGVFNVEGSIIYTAANGSELHALVVGTLNGLTGQVAATVTYIGGTGRFADATGSSALAGQMLPGGALSISVSGSIDY